MYTEPQGTIVVWTTRPRPPPVGVTSASRTSTWQVSGTTWRPGAAPHSAARRFSLDPASSMTWSVPVVTRRCSRIPAVIGAPVTTSRSTLPKTSPAALGQEGEDHRQEEDEEPGPEASHRFDDPVGEAGKVRAADDDTREAEL